MTLAVPLADKLACFGDRTLTNFVWFYKRRIFIGTLCRFQGGITQVRSSPRVTKNHLIADVLAISSLSSGTPSRTP